MTKQEYIKLWLKVADQDLDTAQSCFDVGRYHACMNISHVVLEQALKANWVRDMEHPVPAIRDLREIARVLHWELSNEQEQFLVDMALFDFTPPEIDYECKARKLCTKEFSTKYFATVKELYQFLNTRAQSEYTPQRLAST